MVVEKIFKQSVGREAKMVLKGQHSRAGKEIFIEMEFLVKEAYDGDFREPIGVNHPKYWKLKRLTPENAQYMQLEYSGISRKQVLEAVREFELSFPTGSRFAYAIPLNERIKSLKGIRIRAVDRRMLAAV